MQTEISQFFKNHEQRIETVWKAMNGDYPENMSAAKLSLLKRMTETDPNLRPNASQLVEDMKLSDGSSSLSRPLVSMQTAALSLSLLGLVLLKNKFYKKGYR